MTTKTEWCCAILQKNQAEKFAITRELMSRRAEVGRREDLRLPLDSHTFPRAEPAVDAVDPESELVDAVVEADKRGRARPVIRDLANHH